jgi:G:T/U-mismatch repair DNA glycosylase
MNDLRLKPFLRPDLDVLFVALNPAEQSNANGHYFSGDASRFFHLLHLSGLITCPVSKATADEVVFGSTRVNFDGCEFGVVDLVEDVVQTQSEKVHPMRGHVATLVARTRAFSPRYVCIIHGKVRKVLNEHGGLERPVVYGMNGALLPGSPTKFVLNYFPNGNNIADAKKLEIFRKLRSAL